MRLIVNADDFGKSLEVNRAITECFNRGIINRTTVMTNMPYAAEAAAMAMKNGFMEHVGLHLNFTEGTPLSDSIKMNRDFCDENGNYNQAFYYNTKLRLHMNDKSIFDIEQEIEAQIELYHDLGFNLNHIDSHHHVHTNMPFYKALKNLSSVYSFSSIRLSRNLYKDAKLLKKLYKNYYNNKIRQICSTATDYFGSFHDVENYFIYPNDISSVNMFKEFIEKNDLEIMVHPQYSSDSILCDSEVPFEEEIKLYEAFI